jgi:hypothetical protein
VLNSVTSSLNRHPESLVINCGLLLVILHDTLYPQCVIRAFDFNERREPKGMLARKSEEES